MTVQSRLTPFIVALIVCALIASCAKAPAQKWRDGVYQGEAQGLHSNIAVTVKIEKGKIAAVVVDKQGESAGISDVAFTRIPQEIVEKQSTAVSAVTGASVSSNAIMKAVENALVNAATQTGVEK